MKKKELNDIVKRLPFNGTDHKKELKKALKNCKDKESALQGYFDKVTLSITPPQVHSV